MSTKQDLENIEITIEDAKTAIARRDALIRLQGNKDFTDLIEEGFLKDHALRQVMLKSAPGYSKPEMQAVFDNQIIAVGSFKQYLVSIFTMGMNAEEALIADEATREDLLQEDLTNG